jgi:peptidoglycan hydrolase-like protein with peptidoglycan-binding domain
MLSTIRLNSTGDIVKIAQYMLNYAERGKADGIFDDRFAAEVGDWQAKHNLTADYIIGPNTWSAMAKAMPTCSTSKNRTSVYTCAIQLLVGGLTVDGIYGNGTKKGVTAYQSAAGLTADGICGPKTWNSLIGAAANNEGQVINGNKVLNNCVKYL